MSQSTSCGTHALKKAQKTSGKKDALNNINQELAALVEEHRKTAAKIKDLKAKKSEIALFKPGQGCASKAESSSSGRALAAAKAKAAFKAVVIKTSAYMICYDILRHIYSQ